MYIKDTVLWKTRPYGSILYDTKTREKVKLNQSGTRMFLMHCNRRRSLEDIVKVYVYEYEIDEAEVEKDVKEVFDTVVKSGMVTDDMERRGYINMLEPEPHMDACTLVITGKCNLNCRHCIVSGSRKMNELTTDEIKTLLDDLVDFKIFDLVVTGGEPLTRKDFMEILNYCDDRNIHVTLFTNGTLVTDEFIDKVKDKGIMVRMSLDGATKETNDFMRGEGVYEKVISAIKKCKDAGIETGLASVIYAGNFHEYEKLSQLAQELGVSEFEMTEVLPFGFAKDHPEFLLSTQQLEELRSYCLLRVLDTPMFRAGFGTDAAMDKAFSPEELKGREMCTAGRSVCAITPEGDVYPCQPFMDFPEMKTGNIRETPILDIWGDSPIFEEFRRLTATDIEKCASCECLISCAGGCRARAYARTKDLYAPMDDEFCEISLNIWNKFCKPKEEQ